MPEIVPLLGKLSKLVGSFCIRCGLGYQEAKWAPLVHGRFLRKPQINIQKGEFWVSRPLIVGSATSIPLFMEYVSNIYDTFINNLN